MVGEAAEKKLYDAATKGDVSTFQEMVQQDPHLLDVVSFASSRNILHIAVMWGQESIVEEVLKINPRLARDLDSKMSSSLHIAAAQGSLEIVQKLLPVSREACWWRDCHDMNPIHIAAMKGHDEVLKELLQLDSLPAMERLHRGQTVLHLCVKHRKLSTLKVLVEKLGELVCAKDDDGETLLHLAVRCNQREIIRFLVRKKIKGMELKNSMGKTPLQMSEEIHDGESRSEMKRILTSDERGWKVVLYESGWEFLTNKSLLKKLSRKRDQTMVAMVLIAAMAFQAAVSPPGGVWQDETSSHKMGEAVMATTHPKLYKHFIRANNTAFVSSVVTIFFLAVEPLPIVAFAAWYLVWVSLASISVSYAGSVLVTTPNTETQSLSKITIVILAASFSFYGLRFMLFRGLIRKWCSSRMDDFRTPQSSAAA